jgi:hypothetical protein
MSLINVRQQALTRPKFDDHHQVDDMRITSYAARYYLNPPEHNCQTVFPVNATARIQASGNSWVAGQWKTDVESDLRGINRLGNRIRCDEPGAADRTHYNPVTNRMNNLPLETAPDQNFTQTFNRLNNPPCTLRATGWNRWIPLLHNPQETFEQPFDYFIPSRLLDKERCKTH